MTKKTNENNSSNNASDTANPFANFDFTKLVSAWQENPYVKPVLENQFFKQFQDQKMPEFDFESIRKAQDKNIETLRAMSEATAASMTTMLEKQTELVAESISKMQEYAQNIGNFSADDAKANMAEMQSSIQHAVSRTSDIAEAARKDGAAVAEIASARIKESVNELEDFVQDVNNKLKK